MNEIEIINRYKTMTIEERYKFIKRLLPQHTDVFASQEGEDVLIKRILKWNYNKKGFYIDIGAHDPVRFSNTFHYYLKGWHGINIDPIPGMKDLFDQIRPRDINLECGISAENDTVNYYIFNEPAFNTFSLEQLKYALTRTKLKEIKQVKVYRLDRIFEKYLTEDQDITFMNIDVEGLELQVLQSSNWEKYRPNIVCIEVLTKSEYEKINSFLNEKRYTKVAQIKNSFIFCENSFWDEVK